MKRRSCYWFLVGALALVLNPVVQAANPPKPSQPALVPTAKPTSVPAKVEQAKPDEKKQEDQGVSLENWDAQDLISQPWPYAFHEHMSTMFKDNEYWYFILDYSRESGLRLVKDDFLGPDQWNTNPRLKAEEFVTIPNSEIKAFYQEFLKVENWLQVNRDQKLENGLKKVLYQGAGLTVTFVTGEEPVLEFKDANGSLEVPEGNMMELVNIFKKLPFLCRQAEAFAKQSSVDNNKTAEPSPTPTPEGQQADQKRIDDLLK